MLLKFSSFCSGSDYGSRLGLVNRGSWSSKVALFGRGAGEALAGFLAARPLSGLREEDVIKSAAAR